MNGTSEICFNVISQISSALPNDSYLLVEGDGTLGDDNDGQAANTAAYNGDKRIALVREDIPNVFQTITYYPAEKYVKCIYHPGICQNMLSYIRGSNIYHRSISLVHCGARDTSIGEAFITPIDNNTYFLGCRKLLKTADEVSVFCFHN